MDHTAAPGWHPEGTEGVERWWDGAAWTEHRRRSRYPYFVERDGKLKYTGKKLFPAGDDEYIRLARRTQWWMLADLVLLVLALFLLIPLMVYKPAAMIVYLLLVLGVLVASLFPAFRVAVLGREIRDQYLRNELYVPVGVDGTPTTSIQSTPPNWPAAATPA